MAPQAKRSKKSSEQQVLPTKWGYYMDTLIGQADEPTGAADEQSDGMASTLLQAGETTNATSIQEDGEFAKLGFGENKYLVYCVYRGTQKIHIREYTSSGKTGYPTKKGICVNISGFARLYSAVDDIVEAINQLKDGKKSVDLKQHLGSGMYASVKYPYMCLNLRKFFKPAELVLATKIGITIKVSEIEKFVECVKELAKTFPHLVALENICEYQHYNQEAAFSCTECHPFDNIILI